jgi:hypothetical protein
MNPSFSAVAASRGEDEIALVLPVFVVDHDDHLAPAGSPR